MAVYLDISIGDAGEYASQVAAYQAGQQVYASLAHQMGITAPIDEMDDEAKELLTGSSFSGATNGPIRFDAPTPIHAGRITVELFDAVAPKAVANFRCLCTGEKGLGKNSKKALHFQGTSFHRIVQGFCCQGGDIVKGDGSGGESIYGGKFNDEKSALKLKHDQAGILSMANSGKNSNSSQFFFTLAPAPQCDGKHVVIGRVTDGMDVLARINDESASKSGSPNVPVTISACGLMTIP